MQFDNGVYTVIPTFFNESANMIDIISIMKHIKFQISSGIKNIVLLGTTSETPTLSDSEQLAIVHRAWDLFKYQVNIIVGVSGNNTDKVLVKAHLFKNKSHALMLIVPYYNKPTQEGIYAHFSKLSSNLEDISILLYNIPSRCGVNMEPWVIAKLNSNFPNIKAIKEASGSLDQVSKIISLCDITVLSGDDCLTLPMLSVGAKGVVSIASNIIPNMMLDMVSSFFNNKINKSIEIHKKLYPIIKSLFIESNPVPLKYILKKNGYCDSGYVRLPLVNITNSEHINVLNAICNTVKPTVSMTYSL